MPTGSQMNPAGVSRRAFLRQHSRHGHTDIDHHARRGDGPHGRRPAGSRCTRTNHRRQEPAAEARRRLPARARASVDRGLAGRRQDHARPRARARARPLVSAHPVHERPVAGRRARRIRVPSRHGPLRVPQGPDLRAAGARRRDQPRDSESAERAARGDGGAASHGRRHHVRVACTVLRRRDAQSRSPDRYVPAARVAARSLPHAARARLPRAEGRAPAARGRRAARAGRSARSRVVARCTAALAGASAEGARVGAAARLRAGVDCVHAQLRGIRRGSLAARGNRARARVAGVGADERPRRRASGGRPGRARCDRRAPPATRARQLDRARCRSRARRFSRPCRCPDVTARGRLRSLPVSDSPRARRRGARHADRCSSPQRVGSSVGPHRGRGGGKARIRLRSR